MGVLRSAFDFLCLIFFISHIPITALVDSQALFPREWYPNFATTMMDNFIRDYKDPLMNPPLAPWFKSFVWAEVGLQLPFFFIATYAFIARCNWIRLPAIIYGTFVCASMLPILTVIATHKEPGYDAVPVLAFYMPYLLIPGALVAVMVANPVPFSSGTAAVKSWRGGKAKRG